MRKGYLFIANGRVVPREQELSLDPVKTGSFEAPCMYAANELGFKLYMGINRDYADQLKGINYDITFYNQHIYRSIFNIKDISIGYKNLCRFLEEHPDIEIIHCNTPIGGVLGRICGKKYGKKVIYMAHGFHFYKGAPFLNRTLFKLIEKVMALKTDCLITINQEDYEAAQKFKLNKGGQVYKVNGVGIDTQSFESIIVDKTEKRRSLGLSDDAFIGIVVGDLNDNKNVGTIIMALPDTPSNVHILICGFGPNEQLLKQQAIKLGVSERCHFLGFRTDVKELLLVSDVFLFASKREGLPRSTMEAMLASLPCVVSKIRGNVDLIEDGKGGFLVSPTDARKFAEAINELASKPEERKQYGDYNRERINSFDIKIVEQQMLDIYKSVFENNSDNE